jgi:hypothetical protein
MKKWKTVFKKKLFINDVGEDMYKIQIKVFCFWLTLGYSYKEEADELIDALEISNETMYDVVNNIEVI